jgi:hypothetical protein
LLPGHPSGIFWRDGIAIRGVFTVRDQLMSEFAALRVTIRERGTARVIVFWLGIAVWAALVVVLVAAVPIPAAVLVPLLVLLATFEAVYGLHVGVERVGRYLQVFHQDAWETTAMAYGQRYPGGGLDPLYSSVFALATVVNLIPMLASGPTPGEWIPLGLAHALFILRVHWGRRRAAGQRAEDLERFRALAAAEHPSPSSPASDA